ncbi:MAG: 1-deoxy-D-xylulose-5-phosphate synthase [Methylococcales symbiont of Hymedesmia sp. n. MRB-2018]|nr:MAG: 1-deoxy-D-xylulose-5-phosphate synthase [Methylococcales symbiont of Hymedesmia sp. n. MRB-2018]
MNYSQYPLLNKIELPADVRKLDKKQLKDLSAELRDFLTHTVSISGGHFSAGLGTVELTVALHYIFNTPEDQLVWDVGHQAYPHKILTGRKEQMLTIRSKGGICAFPNRAESEYDAFGVGHSSTSISAALGMAIASQLREEDKRMVAIIGDGSITGGMAFEAMNHAGALDANLLVILNDNDMSISPPVGAMNNYFTRVISSKFYSSVRAESKKVLSRMPSVWDLARKTEEHVKGMIVPGTLFEELGFNYIGPIDGHDVNMLVDTLANIKDLSGPVFLHVVTKKGKGYAPAEKDPLAYHGVPAFDPMEESLPKSAPSKHPTYTQVFGSWLCDMAKQDKRLLGITPAMREGSGLVAFSECFPDRYFDVAIAEQHAVTLAAGHACQGAKPVVAIYSTFLQRAYDQLIHDVAIQNLDVLFALDRAGLVGPDGPTHAGSFDYSYLACIPNMLIMAPADENECRQMLTTGYHYKGPASVRYPRGKGPGAVVADDLSRLEIAKSEIRHQGGGIAILAWGSMVTPALEAGKQLAATVINMRFVKPLDEAMILQLAKSHDVLVTIEENVLSGGAGSLVNGFLQAQQILMPVLNIALPDAFIEQGTREELLAQCGLDAKGVLKSIEGFCA